MRQLLTLKQPGPHGVDLQGNISKIKYSLSYGQDIQRIWLKKNKYRIN